LDELPLIKEVFILEGIGGKFKKFSNVTQMAEARLAGKS
jgi:hypothetical protein